MLSPGRDMLSRSGKMLSLRSGNAQPRTGYKMRHAQPKSALRRGPGNHAQPKTGLSEP